VATVVQRAEADSSSNTTSYTLPGAAFTPVEGDQLVIGLVCSATTDDVPTLVETAGGGTYSLVHSQPWSGTSARLYVFVRDTLVGASPAARQLTLTLTDAATGCAMEAMAVPA
jgi:hypothetical protein